MNYTSLVRGFGGTELMRRYGNSPGNCPSPWFSAPRDASPPENRRDQSFPTRILVG
ncbi:MAG: hypothetical protein Ct9H300mP16_19930 [Pseudomonadota bacterium]|nr:MAG: hypothetical protein Ct9H300mP16_19930 [Pseudomonadota bacterium]